MTSSFKSLRYTTAIAVSLVALSTANQANAQCAPAATGGNDTITCAGVATVNLNVGAGNDTVTNTGTLTSPVSPFLLSNSGTLDFNNSGDITLSGTGVLHFGTGESNITNSGTISFNGANAATDLIVHATGAADFTLNNSGSLIYNNTGAVDSNGTAIDLLNNTGVHTINNTGSIIASGGQSHAIARSTGSSWLITNSGTLTGAINFANATGGGSIINQAGGVIDENTSATGVNDDIILSAHDDTINNAGTITVATINLGAGNDTFINSGTITGDLNYGSGTNNIITNTGDINSSFRSFEGTGDFTLTNSGNIIDTGASALLFTSGIGDIVNSGRIEATNTNSDLLRYNSIGNRAGESITITNQIGGELIHAGTGVGNAAIELGNGTLDSISVINDGIIDSEGRAIRFEGATLNTVIINNTGTITSELEAIRNTTNAIDLITNFGDITGNIDTFNGADILTNNAGATITGDVNLGNGDDVIMNAGTITSNTSTLATIELSTASGADQITNTVSGVIENTGANKSAIDINQTAADFIRNAGTISGTAEAIFLRNGVSDLTGGLLNEATGKIIGNSDGATHSGIAGNHAIRIDNNLSGGIDNRGLIEDMAATAIGLEGANVTGAINNSGTITGVRGGIVLSFSDLTMGIDNSGTINGDSVGISVGSSSSDISGGVTNRSGGVISGSGTTGTGISVASFSNDISGGVTNEAGGTITGGAVGISVVGSNDISGGVDNSGTISGTGASGTGILIENDGDISSGIINNTGGTITGLREGILVGTSTDLSGAITNNGIISGGRGGIYLGGSNVDISGGVTNNAGGVITGDTGIFVSSSSAISGGISNSGIIQGTNGIAINLQGLNAATPITIAGGRIIGDVTDGDTTTGFSPVTVTGTGFKTEGNFTVSDLMVDAGQDFTISADNTVTLHDMTASAGTLIFELSDSSDALLTVTGGDVDISNSIIGVVSNNRSFSAGDSILIGTGTTVVNGGAGQALEDIIEDLTFFDLQIADGATGGVGANNELYLLVSRASNPCTGQFSDNPDGACGALSQLTGTTNPELLNVINNIGGAEAEDILEATLPQIDGGSFAAAQNITGNTLRLVSDRLTIIRDGNRGASGLSSGDLTEDLQMWGQVFGQKIDQGQRGSIAGYDAITRGITFGADTEGLHDNATVGVAIAYANTDVKSDSINNTRSDINSYNISLYGDYDLDKNTYLIGDVGYTYGNNEATRFNVGGVAGLNAKSDYGSHQIEARLIAARDYNPTEYEGVRITPKVQAHYIRYQNEDISETGAGGAGLEIDSEALNILEVGVGVDVRKDYIQENGGILSPEVSVGYRYDLIDDAVQTTSTFAAGGPSFRTEGADPDQDTLNLGFGVGYTAPSDMEFTVSYDYEREDEFNSHSALLRLAAPF